MAFLSGASLAPTGETRKDQESHTDHYPAIRSDPAKGGRDRPGSSGRPSS
ncbi:hypothetical protein SBA3_1580013 [Candidatus Sulfopaludibacter sp. SbA3]|nr:hypothetical protein SBA3_1580013 [Candidatus Sulfopaludibacter sp. SbA3]